MNRIFTHKSGAELWQGDIRDVRSLIQLPHSNITVIGLFAQEHQPDDPSGNYELVKGGYNDSLSARGRELNKISDIAGRASDLFSDRLREGKGCLSSCAMGLNRSGLVTALTLMKVADMDPEEAVRLIRSRREPQSGMKSLCNPRFVELIHDLASVVGTKSAWSNWQR